MATRKHRTRRVKRQRRNRTRRGGAAICWCPDGSKGVWDGKRCICY